MSADSTSAENASTGQVAMTSSRITVLMVFQWAMATGVATGLVEASVRGFQRHVLGRLLYMGPHFFWLSPIVNMMIFLVVAVGIVIAVKLLPRTFSPRVVAWIFLFVGTVGLRGIAPRIHTVAWLILSAGAATALSKLFKLRSDRSAVCLRRTAIGAVLACLVLAVIGNSFERVAEHRAIANLPSASPGAPNLLWIVLDTVPSKRMSLYGYEKPTTPQLAIFSKSGVVFERCIATSPWTLPSHATMFTGTMPREQSGRWVVPLDDSHPTLGEILQQRGYLTAGFVANTYYGSAEFGLNRGFGRYREPRTLLMQAIKSSQLAQSIAGRTILPIYKRRVVGRRSVEDINRESLNWMAKHVDGNRPYFVFLNLIDTHGPYLPPDRFDEEYEFPRPRNPFPSASLYKRPDAKSELDKLTRAFEGCLTYLDDQVSRLLAELSARGSLDNTIVVIVGDHGEQLGENRVLGHGNSLYLPQLHVPLIISFPPRLPAGRRVRELVSVEDLAATVVELLGITESPLPGLSMVELMDGAAPSRDGFIARAEVFAKPPDRMEEGDMLTPLAKGEMRSAVSANYHYILNGDGREELYRYTDDPEETNNLVMDTSNADVLDRLRRSAVGRQQGAQRGSSGATNE